jgi:hypothetical protein
MFLMKQRLIADRDRVIAEQLKVIATFERHPDLGRSAITVALCLTVIAECERLKVVFQAAP